MSEEIFAAVLQPAHSTDRVQKPQNGAPLAHSTSSAAGLPTSRSCVTCRKRKVKCDKKHPCSNCARAKIECIFPGPGRAPRKSRKPPEGELMERLRRLEGVVQSLNAQVEEEQNGEKVRHDGYPIAHERLNPVSLEGNTAEGLESRFGRLVIDQGRSRYVSNSFWANLNTEVEDLKSILIEPPEEEPEDHSSPDSNFGSQHASFMFGYSSSNVDMLALHPDFDRARSYWEIYKENVDPLVKVIHVPSDEIRILEAMEHPEKVAKGLECLIFAIYYGAVTSVTPKECQERWGEDQAHLLQKYRFGMEQALARANFLFCDEIIILQAFLIFLVLLRRNDDARKIWTLTGLLVRISQTLGIHRDGSHFSLKPFEIEMRRRLWWQVLILDARASEDHGCDPSIVEAQFDTKMPLNVNDSDLDPNMTELPKERVGFTDMTFCLIRFEVCQFFRRILYVPPSTSSNDEHFVNLSIPEKEKRVGEYHAHLEERYLKDCDLSIPLCWVTATISRLVMSKTWLIVYHPHQRRDGGATLPQETKDKLFITSLENIEYSILLETETRTSKWGWLFRTYIQWHAIAFLLSELCVRTKGEAVERAWAAIKTLAGQWWYASESPWQGGKGRRGCLWRPLRKLMVKAKEAKAREEAMERASQTLQARNSVYGEFTPMYNGGFGQPQRSESVDALLRPSPPKAGEVPSATPPNWSGSPWSPATSPEGFAVNTPGSGSVGGPQNPPATTVLNRPKAATIPAPTVIPLAEAAREFQDLTSLGFDFLMRDIMDTTTYDEPVPTDAARSHLASNVSPTNTPGTNSSFGPNIRTSSSGAFTGTPSTFSTSPFDPNAVPINATATHNGSPVLENGQLMDWANWDNMVREYSIDVDMTQGTLMSGPQGQAQVNGVLGIPTWF